MLPSRGNWSGRRGSNPRPTAWKAVTLPLSYSRPVRVRRYRIPIPDFLTRVELRVYRMLVAREGLEPSKPLGRQIYSLLRLTASLPRQLSVLNVTSSVPRENQDVGAGEGIRTPDLLITNQLLYRPELRQPDKRGTIALSVPAAQDRYGSIGWPWSSSARPRPV